MLQDEILQRLSQIKHNMHHLLDESKDFLKEKMHNLTHHKNDYHFHIDNYHYESHRIDDLELTLNKDESPGVKFYTTENSELAHGAAKETPKGIDSFGEEDTFDPDEIDEGQDFRNRKQNSDLSERYRTSGLHDKDFH